MEREPPPITIVDPHAPVGGGEVLAGEPWHMGERQHVAALALAIVALLVAALGTARDLREQERETAAAVRLATDVVRDPGVRQGGYVLVGLRNDGPDRVHLLAARLTPGRYDEIPVDAQVPSGGLVTIAFPDEAPCGRQLLATPPDAVRVRLRTVRGTTVSREVALSPGAYGEVNHAALERCGYLPAYEAFSLRLTSVSQQGSTVVARAVAFDDSVLPLTLRLLAPAPGLALAVTPTPPVALPPQPAAQTVRRTVPLTLQLRVHSCEVFLGTLGLREARGSQHVLRAWLVRDSSIFEVPALDAAADPGARSPADPYQVLTRLVETCPARR